METFEISEAGKELDDLLAEYDQYSVVKEDDYASSEPDPELDLGEVGGAQA